ncbi:MAG: hypothetical protein Q9167_002610 [Letrouitia subvulpina]
MGSITPPKPWIETPLIESAPLSKAAGCRIFLKLENLQPAGSFKTRGIGNLLLQSLLKHPEPSKVHFYCSSGGNAGLACVTAAASLGHPATVIVPQSTKPLMIAKIKTAGASDVIQVGANWKEADTFLREQVLSKDPNGVYVPPFDHPDVWEGNSTMIPEIGRQMAAKGEHGVDAVVCSVGGGGLFCGIMLGLEREQWGENVQVLALETDGAQSLHESIKLGTLATLPQITSIATSLGASRVAPKALELALKHNIKSAVLSDAEAAMGCWRLADDERLVVEAACGINVAVCYGGRLGKLLTGLTPESKVVIVVCGGSNITLETLMHYREEYGYIEASEIEEREAST